MTYYYKILFLSILVPFIYSFHSKIKFYNKFPVLLKSIPLVATPFIIWDIIFTNHKIWGFNKTFTSNLYIYNLPAEEVLFFIFIPFCCLYTYHVIEKYKISFFKKNNFRIVNASLILLLIIVALLNHDKHYTFYCLLFCSLLILLDCKFIKNIRYDYYYTAFILLMIPFFLVNGALTGAFFNQTVVWYNPSEIIGMRILTIPVEDIIYTNLMLLSNLITYNYFSNKDSNQIKSL